MLGVGRGEDTSEQEKRAASGGVYAQPKTVPITCKTGKWQSPFDPVLTKEDDFMVDDKTKV